VAEHYFSYIIDENKFTNNASCTR